MRRPTLACLAALLAAMLGACAYPQRVADPGPPQEFASTADARQLVQCVVRNARSFSGAYTASWSELVRPDNYEAVVIRSYSPIYHYPPIIVAHTSPAPDGSRLLLYISREFGPEETADWIARLRRGCEGAMRAVQLLPIVPREALPAENTPPPKPVPASPSPGGRPTRG